MDTTRQPRPAAKGSRGGLARPAGRTDARAHDHARLVTWRRRHLNLRSVVALVALSSLVLPGVAAIIEVVV